MRDVLTLILAGGRGSRLEPLTRDRAKPAVPFGGLYRVIDFPLSNCLNSGLRRVLVLTQYKAHSLDRHLAAGWGFLSRALDEYIDVLPPQQRVGDGWYEGTADALYQNIYTLERSRAKQILVLSGDHVYKMDYADLIAHHRATQADLTVATMIVPLDEGRHFGVIRTDSAGRITSFVEKPQQPEPLPDDPSRCLVSMGVYVFHAEQLYEQLCRDAMFPGSRREIGTDLLKPMLATHRVVAFNFQDRNAKATPYWRDIGTIESYYQANMDLIAVEPVLNLYDKAWPIRTLQPQLPPPKFVHSERDRRGEAIMSMVCQGCILSGGSVRHSILSPNVRINSYAQVEDCLLFADVEVGRRCRLRRVIVDKGVKLPQNTTIGYDREHDRARGYAVSESGVVVVPRAD
ncbi:MAG: glucose-1-phosphate adenylyltransferase [Planctomycetia bacterium]|nr:glucose-1-phosphate adenylyltransferase [Planctomycetia bacterium]